LTGRCSQAGIDIPLAVSYLILAELDITDSRIDTKWQHQNKS
jgi:hypothetical protein